MPHATQQQQNWANLRFSLFGKWKMAAGKRLEQQQQRQQLAGVAAQEIALLIRTVARVALSPSLSMHYLNLKARQEQQQQQEKETDRQAARVPCFSFINLAVNSFIKLSAAIIYAPPPSARPLTFFSRCVACAKKNYR